MADKQTEIIELVNRQEQNLTLDEAKAEYLQLKARLNDGTLWMKHIVALGENRLNFLRTLIADIVSGVKK